MRYLGKSSAAFVLGVLLDVAWGMAFFGMGVILLCLLALGFFSPQIFPHSLLRSFAFDTQFIKFSFSRVDFQSIEAILFGFLGFILLALVVFQAVIYQMRRIFATLKRGTPFTMENARRIRIIGLVIIGGSLLQSLATSGVGYLMMQNIIIEGVELHAKLGAGASSILIGLVILILAEIFRYGASLQEDQDLTV
ncbi:MAG: DUF2975 domain-containing protein [Bacteroidota bacterium]